MNNKACSKCGIVKPLSEFYKQQANKDGHSGICKGCKDIYQKQYHAEHCEERSAYLKQWRRDNPGYDKQYRIDHREERLAYKRQYRIDHRDEEIAYRKQYYLDHRDEILEHHRQYYAAHREKRSVYNRQYHRNHSKEIAARRKLFCEAHPERARHYRETHRGEIAAKWRRRRALRAETVDTLTSDQSAVILAQGCWFCDATEDLTLAHNIPVSKQGNTTAGNVFCLCRRCNSSMATKSLSETIEQLELV